QLGSTHEGLTPEMAAARLGAYGPNLVAHEGQQSLISELLGREKNPLNFLLLTLAAVSLFLGDRRAAVVIAVMVLLSVSLAFVQEHRSNKAAARVRGMVGTPVGVVGGCSREESNSRGVEIPMEGVVRGDVVRFPAGDMTPADLRILAAKDLFLNEAALTGEA